MVKQDYMCPEVHVVSLQVSRDINEADFQIHSTEGEETLGKENVFMDDEEEETEVFSR